jgi:hypothetical protein
MGGRGSGRKRGPVVNAARHAEMARLRDQGLTLAEVGQRLGVSRQCVQATLRRCGYEPSPEAAAKQAARAAQGWRRAGDAHAGATPGGRAQGQ